MIKGFSKLSTDEKQKLILEHIGREPDQELFTLTRLGHKETEELITSFSENVISIFPFPYSIAPNFLIDGQEYLVPFVTEESSVVAAAAKSAKFWFERGGFKTEIIGNTKYGQIHIISDISFDLFNSKIEEYKDRLFAAVASINDKMIKRGGGIKTISLLDKRSQLSEYFQLNVGFNTCDAMGANYMNSCLEGIANEINSIFNNDPTLNAYILEVVMSILSNYSPENAVKIWVDTPVSELDDGRLGMDTFDFARKFVRAVKIAEVDVNRAVTHNKGMYNGIDSVALATGNDWRAIEANGHAYASKSGTYSSLSHATVKDDIFRFEAIIPMQVGTVGGVTALHPLTKLSLDILGNPSAEELMKVIAAAGLASNFAAVKALTTTGIQKGHMKMHLSNILSGLGATAQETELVKQYFSDKTISNAEVEHYLKKLRSE